MSKRHLLRLAASTAILVSMTLLLSVATSAHATTYRKVIHVVVEGDGQFAVERESVARDALATELMIQRLENPHQRIVVLVRPAASAKSLVHIQKIFAYTKIENVVYRMEVNGQNWITKSG